MFQNACEGRKASHFTLGASLFFASTLSVLTAQAQVAPSDVSGPTVQTGNGDGVFVEILADDADSWRVDSQSSQEETGSLPSGLNPLAANAQACVVATDAGAVGRSLGVTLTYTANFDYSNICNATWIVRLADGEPFGYEDVVCDYVVADNVAAARAYVGLTDGGLADLDGVENNQVCFSMTPTFPDPIQSNPDNIQNGVELAVRALDADNWEIDTVSSELTDLGTPEGKDPIAARTEACIDATDAGEPGRKMGVTLTYSDDFDYNRICAASWITRDAADELVEFDNLFCDYVTVDTSAGARAHVTLEDGGEGDTDGLANNRICMSITPTFGNADGDTLLDDEDQCPNTPEDETSLINEDGCGPSERDTDGDGVVDADDFCPATPPIEFEFVEADGCSPNERDTDGDGVIDLNDAFPTDPTETEDSDGDGFGDNEEAASGSDPNNPDDYPVQRLPIWIFGTQSQ